MRTCGVLGRLPGSWGPRNNGGHLQGRGETLVKMRLLLSVSQPRPQTRPHLGPVHREFDVVGLGCGFPAQAILVMAKVEKHRLGGLVWGDLPIISRRHPGPPKGRLLISLSEMHPFSKPEGLPELLVTDLPWMKPEQGPLPLLTRGLIPFYCHTTFSFAHVGVCSFPACTSVDRKPDLLAFVTLGASWRLPTVN